MAKRAKRSSKEYRKEIVDGWVQYKRCNQQPTEEEYLALVAIVKDGPIIKPRTLRDWKVEFYGRTYNTKREKKRAKITEESHPPTRQFGEDNIDNTNKKTYANFDFVSKNLKHQCRVGSQDKVRKPDAQIFNLHQELVILETNGDLRNSITDLAGFNLPTSWRFSLDIIPSRFVDLRTQKTILGGKLPDYKFEEERCYKGRHDAAVVVAWPAIKIGSKGQCIWNFGCVHRLQHRNEDMAWLFKYESMLQKAVPTYVTQGMRVGPHQVLPKEYDQLLQSNWFKECTQQNRNYIHKQAVNPYMIYDSVVDGRTVKAKLPQRRCIGIRRSINEVERMLIDYPQYRRIRIAEQQSRLCFQIFVCRYILDENEMGVPHENLSSGETEGILQQVNEALDTFYSNKEGHLHFWREATGCHLTEMEVFHLEYICKTGTLLQHDQLACHCDVSEGHVIETSSMVAKVSPNDSTRTATEIVEATATTATGQTMMPLQDRAFSLQPGIDVAHFRLDGTPHIGDASRGVTNYHKGSHSRKDKNKRRNRAATN